MKSRVPRVLLVDDVQLSTSSSISAFETCMTPTLNSIYNCASLYCSHISNQFRSFPAGSRTSGLTSWISRDSQHTRRQFPVPRMRPRDHLQSLSQAAPTFALAAPVAPSSPHVYNEIPHPAARARVVSSEAIRLLLSPRARDAGCRRRWTGHTGLIGTIAGMASARD